MATFSLSTLLLSLLAIMLMAAAYTDVRERRIPNKITLAIALLAVPCWFATGLAPYPDMLLRLGVAAALFMLFAVFFALGAMGGGDVKLIAATALWLPWQHIGEWLVLIALLGAVLTILCMIVEYHRRRSWRPEIPYGVAIVAASLGLLGRTIY